MAGSLFDQLKKSGLVDDKKAKKIQQEKRQAAKQSKANKSKKGQNQAPINEAAELAAKAAAEKAKRDKKLNQQRQQEQAEKAKKAELKQIIETHQLKNYAGDVAYNFSDNGVVKTLYVNEQTQQSLAKEKLIIVRFATGKASDYALIPAEQTDKIEQRDSSVIVKNESLATKLSQEDEDYYAKFEIPDDLVW